MNPVIVAVDDGHISSWKVVVGVKNKREEPDRCKKCNVPWPCTPILDARKMIRGGDNVKSN